MIETLRLQNFRNHIDSQMALDRVNWFSGMSNSGKSSILAGLQYGVSARNEWTDGKGTGSKTQIRNGQKFARVEVGANNGKSIKSIPPKKDDCMEFTLAFHEDEVRACLQGNWLLEQPAKDQKDFLFKLFPPKSFDLFKSLNEWTPTFPDLGDRWKKFTEDRGMGENIEAHYEEACELRRENKRLLDEEQKKSPSPVPMPSHKTTSKEVEKLRKAWEAEIDADARVDEKFNRAVSEWQALKRQHEQIVEEIAAKSAEKQETHDLESIKRIIAAAEKEIAEIIGRIDKIQEQIKALSGKGKCPVGTCRSVDLIRLNDELAKEMKDEKDFQEQYQAAKQQLVELSWKNEEGKLRQSIINELKEKQAKLPALGPQPVKPQHNSKQKTACDCYQAAKQLLIACEAYERYDNAMIQHRADLEEYESQWKMTDALCDALGPNGLPTLILNDTIKQIVSELNNLLSRFEMVADIEVATWEFTVNGVPVRQLSYSEKSRVSWALKTVVAIHSELNVVGIDEHGMDVLLRSQLFGILLDVSEKHGVQYFVMSTSSEVDENGDVVIPENPAIEGVKVFWVKDGTVTEVA